MNIEEIYNSKEFWSIWYSEYKLKFLPKGKYLSRKEYEKHRILCKHLEEIGNFERSSVGLAPDIYII